MRLKIIAGNLVAVLVVGLVSYLYIKSNLENELGQRVDTQITNDLTVIQRSWRLSAIELMDQTRDRAAIQAIRGAFGALDQDARRRRSYEAVEGIAQWFRDPSRGRGLPPDIVAVTDETGKVIARNADINRLFNQSLVAELPTLSQVLTDGRARHDLWSREASDKLLQVSIAPVMNDEGGTIGALIVGYDVSNGVAVDMGGTVGGEVAFVVEGRVYSSSMEGAAVTALQGHLFGAGQAATTAALGGAASSAYSLDLAGSQYVGVMGPLAMTPSTPIATAVLHNRTEALAPAAVTMIILLMTLLGAVAVLIYGFIIGSSFLKPIEQIEEGVLAVINGNTDVRLDIESSEYGGLAYRINQLINVFTGVSETDEDGRIAGDGGGGGSWGGDSASGGQAPAAAQAAAPAAGSGPNDPIDDANVAAQLAAEADDAYLARVYQDYVAAKQAAGEDVSNIPQDRFGKRLVGNGKALAQKHGCRLVRFQVETRGNQVILRPVLIR